jgi:hypothetical protein
MLAKEIENRLSKYIAFTLAFVTIFVIGSPVSDPVNITKFLVLGILSIGLVGYFNLNSLQELWQKESLAVTLSISFLFFALISSLLSDSPFVQNFYGVTGRNTGLLTYLFFVLIFIAVLAFNRKKSINNYVIALLCAGLINIVYGIWVRFFGDFLPWTNNYGALLGTFGNPDFAGAFLGLTLGVLTSLFYSQITIKVRIFTLLSIIAGTVALLDTKTTQGILVALISISVSTYFKIKSDYSKHRLHLVFATFSLISGLIALLGILQIGPLAKFLYKRSVSLRGVYWDAAINTGNNHFLTGVGLDSFGDWYRELRSVKAATWFPGEGVITNVAHNIFLDMYANGGIFLFLSFSLLNIYAGLRLFKLVRSTSEYNWILVSLSSVYLGYLAQATISINQIGLGIWGWSILAAIIAYERMSLEPNTEDSKKTSNQNKKNSQLTKSVVLVPMYMLFGLVLALPPFISDAKFTSAINFQDLNKLEAALKPGYFTPQSSDRLARATYILGNSNLHEKAYFYAKKGIEFNPRYYDAWNLLYYAQNSTFLDKSLALENMRKLDPNNKKLDKLK